MFIIKVVTTFSADDTSLDRSRVFTSGADNYLPSSLANPNNVPVAINFPSALTI